MAESQELENISPDNERSLNTLARTLKLTQRRFSLILVRCNYTSLREQILQRLRQQCSVEFAELILSSQSKTLYNSILHQVANQPPAALMVLGLESVQALDDLLVAANKARDKFKSDFAFPLVLWVTDRILHKLGRLAPDFNSWASPPIQFHIAPDDVVNSVRQTAEQAFTGDAEFTLDGYDLKALQQDLASGQPESDPELEACLAYILGLLDYRNNRLDLAIAHYQESLIYWQQSNHLERQGILLLNIALAYYRKAEQQRTENQNYWEETRNYFQQSLEIFEQAQHLELVAKHISQLGEVLRRLKAWQELHKLAHKALKLHQDYGNPNQVAQDYGFLAEVALEQTRWDDAHKLAQKALESLATIPNSLPQEQGKYHFLLAKSLRQLGQLSEAVSYLETARNKSQPQYEPLLYIQILEELRSLYFEQQQYQRAFHLKQQQREIESQYGFRAFIGAGRLQPRRQTINSGNLPNQQSKDIFSEVVAAFGRQQDIKSLLQRIGRTDCKLTVIYGQSGVGKSSIVQAGLLPVVQLTSFDGLETLPILVQVYTAWENECGRRLAEKLEEVRGLKLPDSIETAAEIIQQLRQNENRNLITVLIFDQFEEFFFTYKDQASRRPFYDFLRDCLNISYVKIILSLRQDYLHYLLEWCRTTQLPIIDNDILDKNILYYLGNFSPTVAKSVIQSFTENSQFYLEPDLIDALVEDLARELREVRPIELQVIGAQLQTEKITTLEQYRKNWLKEKLVERFLEEVVTDCGIENERAAQLVLYLLTNENNTRPLKTRAELEKDLATEAQNLDLVLEILVGSGLVFRVPENPGDRYQLVHDYLVPFIRQQRSAELLAKLKEAEEQQQRTQEELNRVLQKQLRDARRTGIGLAGLAAVASGFAIVSLLASMNSNNSQLNTLSAASEISLTLNRDMQALIEGIRGGQQLKSRNIGIKDKTQLRVKAALQSAVYGIREVNTLEGHSAAVNTVSFSPNGQLIASGSDDKTIRLWNLNNTVEIQKSLPHNNSVTSLSFSPDSKIIASGTQDGIVNLWKIDSSKFNNPFDTSQDKKVNFLPRHSSKKIASGGLNISQSPQNIQSNNKEDNKSITSINFSPNQQIIAFGSDDGILQIWNLKDKLITKVEGHEIKIVSIVFSHDGKKIVSRDENGILNIWKVDGTKIKTLNISDSGIIGVKFSNNSQTITPISFGSLKLLHNSSRSKENILLIPYIGLYNSLILSPNGQTLVNLQNRTNSNSNSILIKFLNSLDNNFGSYESLNGHTNEVTSLSFSPNGDILASGSKDNTIKLWKIEPKKLETSDNSQVKNVIFSPNGQIIASISENNRVQFWQRDRQALLTTLPGSNSAVSFSKNSQVLVSASQDGTVQLWQRDGKFLATLWGKVVDGSFSSDGKTIALISNDNYNVSLFGNDEKQVKLVGHQGRVYKIRFSSDGQTIATASEDKTIKLWKRDGTEIKTLKDYANSIESMGLSPNGKILVILDGDNTVKFVQRDNESIQTISGEGSSLIKIDFSPDGETLAIRNLDDRQNTVQIWKINGKRWKILPGEKDESISNIVYSSDNKIIGIQYNTYIQLWRNDGIESTPLNTRISMYGNKNENIHNIVFSPDNKTIAIEYQTYIQVRRVNGKLIQTSNTSDSISSVNSQILVTNSSRNGIQLWQNGKNIDNEKQISIDNGVFLSDGKTLAIYTDENEVKLWRINGKKIKDLPSFKKKPGINRIDDIKFIANSETIAIVGVSDTVKLWQISDKSVREAQLIKTFLGHKDVITSVSISPIDNNTIASASKDKTVKLWKHDRTSSQTIQKSDDEVNSISFSPDGQTIALASDDQTTKLWKFDKTLIDFPEKHFGKVNRIIFSPDGKTIASASHDKTVKLWNWDGTSIRALRSLKESYPVTGISFSYDSKTIASATEKTIKLWNVEDGELLSNYQRFGKGDVSFSPKDMTIAAAGNYAVAMWDFDLDELLQRGCNWAWEYLNRQENENKSDRKLCEDIVKGK